MSDSEQMQATEDEYLAKIKKGLSFELPSEWEEMLREVYRRGYKEGKREIIESN